MCSSSNGDHACCPSAQFFQESHCGNFEGETYYEWSPRGREVFEDNSEYMQLVEELKDSVEYKATVEGKSEGVADHGRPSPSPVPRKIQAWKAPFKKNDYIQGTFEIFNSSHSCYPVFAIVDRAYILVEPGNSEIVSVNKPEHFIILAFDKTDGKFCITLYKRVLA